MKRVACLIVAGLMVISIGCKHTAGGCDCQPVPGDSTGNVPHPTYPMSSDAPVTVTPTVVTPGK
ncbi:MAG: hypothetical protein R3B84_23685 [Zavarzinella sp.]